MSCCFSFAEMHEIHTSCWRGLQDGKVPIISLYSGIGGLDLALSQQQTQKCDRVFAKMPISMLLTCNVSESLP